MASVSIGRAWTETSAFVKREAGLLFPVALLFVSIPFALMYQLIPADVRQAMTMPRTDVAALPAVSGGALLGMMLAMLVALTGGLALSALALRPGISVGEALQRAARRLPVLLGVGLCVGIVFLIPLTVIAFASPVAGRLAAVFGALFLSVRLLTLNAVIVDRDLGIVASLKSAWASSGGNFMRLAGFVFILGGITIFAQVVAQMLFGLAGFLIGGREAGTAGADLGTALVLGIAQIYSSTMVARIYRQLFE